MIYETISLWKEHPEATLTSYVCDNAPELKMPPRPAMIVCPGGGYSKLAPRESEPVVRVYFQAGMNVYLLRYSICENAKDYAPLIEAAMAVKYVREHAEEHNTDPERVFISGFSAGGHLAASAGILWNIPEVRDALGISEGKVPEGINRPTGMVLSYPVITAGKYAHKNSIRQLCGTPEPTEGQAKRFSLEFHVDSTTPPVFLWHTFSDATVPVQNSLLLMNALLEHGIPFESHIFPEGVHGLSLANEQSFSARSDLLVPHVQCWSELSVKWIRDMF